MKISYHIAQLAALGSIALLMLPIGARAETQVETRVNARAESGGQVVNDESVRTGDQSVEVRVETIVNGESVEPINLALPVKDGATTVTLEQSTSASTGAAPESRTEVTVNGQPVVPESPQPSNSNQPHPASSSSFLQGLMDWMKELWHNIAELFS